MPPHPVRGAADDEKALAPSVPSKPKSKSLAMFLATPDVARLLALIEAMRARVRRARRSTTHASSPRGVAADRSLHEAEKLADEAIGICDGTGGPRCARGL